jgi:sigma-B regulation protein RsbU (phosphoserine phosphatase)
MLPAHPPYHKKIDFGCVYAPALQVGGDFYDFIELAGGETGICVADVVGKGFPAALLMASLRAALRSRADRAVDLPSLMVEVNRHMCADTLSSEFATLVYGTISADGTRFHYCSAGHNPPLHLRGETLIQLTAGGTVIGIDPTAEFETGMVELASGDIMVFVTDGVTEAMSFEEQTYGQARLEASIVRHRTLSAEAMVNEILWDVRRYAGLAEQSDDITIVVVKVG